MASAVTAAHRKPTARPSNPWIFALLGVLLVVLPTSALGGRYDLPIQVPTLLQTVLRFAKAGNAERTLKSALIYEPINADAEAAAGLDPLARITEAVENGSTESLVHAAELLILADVAALVEGVGAYPDEALTRTRTAFLEYSFIKTVMAEKHAALDIKVRKGLKDLSIEPDNKALGDSASELLRELISAHDR